MTQPQLPSSQNTASKRTPSSKHGENAPAEADAQKYVELQLDALKKVHLVGILGSGMKALAELLSDQGCQVSGSDQSGSQELLHLMEERGWAVHSKHQAEHVSEETDLLIYSPAISETNPERESATRLGIPQLSYTEFLGKMTEQKTGICITGTHGKSTTTAMVGWILECARLEPSVLVGAELCNTQRSGWAGKGPLFVAESCEYRRHFLGYSPQHAAILGIEADHFDCYANLDEAVDAYSAFAERVAESGVLVVSAENQAALEAAKSSKAEVVTFGIHTEADWWATDIRKTTAGQRFRVFHKGEYFTELELDLPGDHNALNALAATALAHYAGCSSLQIREAISRFEGIRRRFEHVGSYRGVTLIDDYAHHPTAVAKTLAAAREKFGKRRILCAYQPHQASRTTALETEFVEALGLADEVYIARTFAAREVGKQEKDPTAVQLAEKLSAQKVPTLYCGSLDRLIGTLDDVVRPGDVLITMGAGDIDRVHHAFTSRLYRNHAS